MQKNIRKLSWKSTTLEIRPGSSDSHTPPPQPGIRKPGILKENRDVEPRLGVKARSLQATAVREVAECRPKSLTCLDFKKGV